MNANRPSRLLTGVVAAWLVASAMSAVGCASREPRDEPRDEPRVQRPTGVGSIVVTVRNLPNDDGQLLINLFLEPDGFPNDPDAAHEARAVPIRDGRAEVRFEDVPAGEFAIAVFHDEDEDRELDKNLIGIPSENWGVSGENDSFMGPPSFEGARLMLAAGEELTVDVEVGN